MSEQLALLRGITERDKIMQRYEDDHALYLATLRDMAIAIAATTGSVSVDDVRRKMNAENFPMPDEIGSSEKIFGRLLSGCKELEPVERIDSTRPERIARSGRNASSINVYRLRRRVEAA